MLKVCCVWVEGNVHYEKDYVYRLQAMVRRFLPMPHDFICFTDRPHLLDDLDTIKIPSPDRMPGWWSKLELFNTAHGLTGQGLYFDLDILIVDNLMPITVHHTDLMLIPHAGDFNGKDGKQVIKRYNSSVMKFGFTAHPELYDQWDFYVTHRLWGDQDWISRQLPQQRTWPLEWFPRLSEVKQPPNWPNEAKVILCKKPKNHVAARRYPWFNEMWG